MIRSMTAFSRAEKTVDAFTVGIEMRTYNSRHLDLSLRMPHGFQELEKKVRDRIAASMIRGRVEVRVQIQDATEAGAAFEVDGPKAEAYHRALLDLKARFDLDGPVGLDLYVSAGLIRPADADRDLEACWQALAVCLDVALADLTAMREKEGAHLARDLGERMATVAERLERIGRTVSGLTELYRQRLEERIRVLTDGVAPIDPARIAQEAAILADRSDISEEIVRAQSHLDQFRDIMAATAPAGQKLNFLLQELNREFNTMGSKCNSVQAAHDIVDVKAELEKIREQVQNVE
ncbi:MAG: YicC family protein [Desulfobacterales bacterium]|nr:YicC family protein [Desulfobacterales bacterium]